jgi:hypothetical protein
VVGPEGDETLVLASDYNWSKRGAVYLACENGWVELEDMR